MELLDHGLFTAEDDQKLSCSLNDITSCPSARILKVLLKRMSQSLALPSTGAKSKTESIETENQQQYDNAYSLLQSLKSTMQKYEYSATKLLDDLHHLQYDHNLNNDDVKFDAAFDFFSGCLSEKGCNVNECPFMRRHYRKRGREEAAHLDSGDNILMDTMAQIHCYFLHSFDIDRLTKEERDRVEMELSVEIGLDDDNNHNNNNGDGDTSDEDEKRLSIINTILTAKRERLRFQRDDRRYRDQDGKHKMKSNELVDFTTMAQVAGVNEDLLKEGLKEYERKRDKLIGDLIDVVYHEEAKTVNIWCKLDMKDEAKAATFRKVLHGYFKNTQLNPGNLIRASKAFITRKRLQIDMDVLIDVVTTNDIDGRMFDKTVRDSYQNNGTFSKRFKGAADCKVQHVRQLYTALRKWKYVLQKPVDEAKQDENEEDGKDDEKELVDDGQHDGTSNEPDIYEIGKRFYFWDSHRKHPKYVAAKYNNMKEEVLNNPLLAGMTDIRAWNALTAAITALLATEKALRICSNGKDQYMYMIKIYEPLEAQHLRSLKLYTDFNDLSAKFCAILRWANPNSIAGIAHLARKLIETVQCFGSTLKVERIKKTYYRGVDRAFIFKRVATRFNLPLSTTSNVK